MATIAVDFDGTIVTHEYPKIGREIPFAIETLKMLIRDQHRLILWSVREGELLQEAVSKGFVDWKELNSGLSTRIILRKATKTTIISHVSSRLITSLMTVTLAVYPIGDRFIR